MKELYTRDETYLEELMERCNNWQLIHAEKIIKKEIVKRILAK